MSIIKNKILIYLSTRYLTYGLQFVLSLIIAVKLGPYYLGVYGMIQLILNYFAQVNFGIPHSLNVLLVHSKNNLSEQNKVSLNSFVLYTILNIIVVVASIFIYCFADFDWGNYHIDEYFFLIIAIAILTYYNNLVSIIVRFRNRVNILSLIGSIPVLLNLLVIFFFESQDLVYALTVANLISCIIVFLIGIITKSIPVFVANSITASCQKSIVKKGFYLFLYNSCFYFILIVVRTVIGGNYSVEEFGFFTFSYTIANAVMLLLDSFNTIIFPKSIDILSGNDSNAIQNALQKLRVGYITSSHLLVYIAMLCFPLLVLLFPKYEPALPSINLISLAVLMNTNSYGYSTLLIAQNKENIASRMSIVALALTIISSVFMVNVLYVNYSLVVISVLIAYMAFSYLASYYGNYLIYGKKDWIMAFRQFFPIRLFIPYIVALIISILELEYAIVLPVLIFLLLNYRDMGFLKKIAMKLIKNPNVIDV